jgi:TRAP-type C4-dicarboxylate transport system permease large subunit
MDAIAYIVGSSLPMALLVFVGSYFGLWKRREKKLPLSEAVIMFFLCWALVTVLIIAFRVLLSGQDELTQSTVGNLWGPLIVGIMICRNLVERRLKTSSLEAIRKTYESNQE